MAMQTLLDRYGWQNVGRALIRSVRFPWSSSSSVVPMAAPMPKYADDAFAALRAEGLKDDLSGKTYAVTGCSRGIGLQLAKTLVDRNAVVFLLNRPSKKADETVVELRERMPEKGDALVHHIDCDLNDFSSVRKCAETLRLHPLVQEKGLHALICNAGVMAVDYAPTTDGYDPQMQANHLSHFLLCSKLMPCLEKGADYFGERSRVVQHTSGARDSPDVPLDWEFFQTERTLLEKHASSEEESMDSAHSAADSTTEADSAGSKRAANSVEEERERAKKSQLLGGNEVWSAKWKRYQQSKKANLCFTYALGDHLERGENLGENKVVSLCAHPGATNSGLQTRTDARTFGDRFVNNLAMMAGAAVEDGALGITTATLSTRVENKNFYGPEGVTGPPCLLPNEEPEKYTEEQKQLLWDESLRAVGEKSF